MLLRAFLSINRSESWVSSPNAMATDNRWTPLHVAATKGQLSAVLALLDFGAAVNAADANGHTSLAIAVARGHTLVVRSLLASEAQVDTFDAKKSAPLHLAAMRGDTELCSLLLDHHANPNSQDSGGWSPLLVTCAKEDRWPATEVLLDNGACASAATYGQNLSALMLVGTWEERGEEAVTRLLRAHANPAAVDIFGQTALHLACRHGRTDVVNALCVNGAPTSAQDNDGQFPLQLLADCCARNPTDHALVDVAMNAIIEANVESANLLDFADASALHVLLLLAGVHKQGPPLRAFNFLLAANADPTREDASGFTAVHYAAALGSGAAEELLATLRASPRVAPEFWTSLDLTKKRDTSNRKYLERRGGAHRIPLEIRRAVLDGDVSASGIARLIADGRCRQVVALVGAGASTAAGVPDFRSPMGLWSQAATRDLFSLEGFTSKPETFWRVASELFQGRQPTKVHSFLARLAREGILRRVYTQNIDGLEAAAGVPAEKIIECHGSAMRSVCSKNGRHCPTHGPIAVGDDRWTAPRCGCGALLRPDIVFFGEALPVEFSRHSGEDMHDCDLLIVIGTALSVYPVAGLVNRVPQLTPRLLINNEAVGVWRSSESNEENYRDVMLKGDCDAGVDGLLRAIGWDLH